MEDIGDGEVIAEGGDDQRDSREQDCSKGDDAGPARGFTETLGVRVVLRNKGEQSSAKAIDYQRQGEEQGKIPDECHEGDPQKYFFRN